MGPLMMFATCLDRGNQGYYDEYRKHPVKHPMQSALVSRKGIVDSQCANGLLLRFSLDAPETRW